MAEFNSYLLGKVRKSVGNITLCYTRGKNIVRAKVFSRKDNPTPEILAHRAKMKILVQLSRQLLPVIRKGFGGIGKGSAVNAFTSLNMSRVSVDENNVATVDFERLLCASGILYPPKVEVTYAEEGKLYSFVQEMQVEENGYAFSDDLVYVMLYETVLGRARLVALRTRGENSNTNYALPEEWSHENVKLYCFATLKNGKRASDSRLVEC